MRAVPLLALLAFLACGVRGAGMRGGDLVTFRVHNQNWWTTTVRFVCIRGGPDYIMRGLALNERRTERKRGRGCQSYRVIAEGMGSRSFRFPLPVPVAKGATICVDVKTPIYHTTAWPCPRSTD